jgi:streptomycin 6-kinase
MIAVPEAFAAGTVARRGELGRRWLERLPGLVAALCADWGLTVDGPPAHGGIGLVVPTRRGDELSVLKVSLGDDSTAHEALALSAWRGRGAALLLAHDPARDALLLERLDGSRSLADVALDEALTVAAGLIRRLAVPAPPGLPGQPDVAAQLAVDLPERWERQGRPVPRPVVEAAAAAALALGPTDQAVIVNRDLHYRNVLAGRREPWLAIDPKGIAGEPALGLAQLLWTRLDEMGGRAGMRRVFDRLVAEVGVDPARARGWALVWRLDYWLWGLSVGLTEDPPRCAAIVEWLN